MTFKSDSKQQYKPSCLLNNTPTHMISFPSRILSAETAGKKKSGFSSSYSSSHSHTHTSTYAKTHFHYRMQILTYIHAGRQTAGLPTCNSGSPSISSAPPFTPARPTARSHLNYPARARAHVHRQRACLCWGGEIKREGESRFHGTLSTGWKALMFLTLFMM